MKRSLHLVNRFVRALSPFPPRRVNRRWVIETLSREELQLWSRQKNHDKRHSIGVARRVERQLVTTAEAGQPDWLAAALLHDVGKLDSGLGVLGRVGATLSGKLGGVVMADDWSDQQGYTRRVGLYLRHPELGATLIRVTGGREVAATWAAAHHIIGRQPPHERDTVDGIPSTVVDALVAADDD